ncbi:hypothetical protein LTR17_009718 [Elasticomyces elasticus]|nr:hypothetical protein LTR17_009718 [Elasticomyces elasticus]
MAEVVAIATAAAGAAKAVKVAWDLGNAIYSFVDKVRDNDSTVENLAAEVRNLGDICDLVRCLLDEVSLRASQNSVAVWLCLGKQVASCENTLDKLRIQVEKLGHGPSTRTARLKRQARLEWDYTKIKEIREQISRHVTNLGLSLQVGLYYSSPVQAQTIEDSETFRKVAASNSSILNMKSERNASTSNLLTKSHVDDDVMSCVQEMLADSATSVDGRAFGGSVRPIQVEGVESWLTASSTTILGKLPTIEVPIAETTTYTGLLSQASELFKYGARFFTTTPRDGIDFRIEVVKGALNNGEHSFEAGQYTEADEALHEALNLLEEVPIERRPGLCDMSKLVYQRAICAFHTKDDATSERALTSVSYHDAATELQSKRDQLYVYSARHLLAHVLVRQGKLDRARESCESALSGRLQLLGDKHGEYYTSLALMAHIFGLLDNRTRARVYTDMIPSDWLPKLKSTMDGIASLKPAQAEETTLIPAPTVILSTTEQHEAQEEPKGKDPQFLDISPGLHPTKVTSKDIRAPPPAEPGSSARVKRKDPRFLDISPGLHPTKVAPKDIRATPPAEPGSPARSGIESGSLDSTKLAPIGAPRRFSDGGANNIRSLSFSRDSATLFSVSDDQEVRLRKVADGQVYRTISLRSFEQAADMINAKLVDNLVPGKLFAVAAYSHEIVLWNEDAVRVRVVSSGQGTYSAALAVSTGRFIKRLAYSTQDGRVHISPLKVTDKVVHIGVGRIREGHKLEVSAMAFSLDGSMLVTGSHDTTVRIWTLDNRRETRDRILNGHKRGILDLAISPSSRTIASVCKEAVLRLWSAAGDLLLTQRRDTFYDTLTSVAFSPDLTILATGSSRQSSHRVILWHRSTGIKRFCRGPLTTLNKSPTPITAVAFSPDGAWLASGTQDGSLYVSSLKIQLKSKKT